LTPRGCVSSATFQPILDLRLRPAVGCLRVNLRLAPPTNLPAKPSCRSSACASDQPLGLLWIQTFGFRLDRSSGCPPILSSACASNRSSGSAFELNFRLTDFQPCSPPACTVLNIANESSRRFASLLPVNRLLRFTDRCFKTRRRLFSRSGPDARSGLSLARNGCFFRSLHSEVNVPGLLLRFQLAASAARSTLLLRYPLPVSPGGGGLIASGPLQFPRPIQKLRLQPPLPFGNFTSLGIKAFCRISNLSARLPNPPDLPSLPAAGFYL